MNLPLAFTKPPLSLNDRMHWAHKARIVRQVREHAANVASGNPARTSATVTLHYQPRQNRKRDKDNLFATLKPCIDGLVDAGVIPADDRDHVEPRVEIHDPIKGEPGRMWLTVTAKETP